MSFPTDENNIVLLVFYYLHSSPVPPYWGYIQWDFRYLFPFSIIEIVFFKRVLPHFHFHSLRRHQLQNLSSFQQVHSH